jgi:heme/copper-type cytochrome/quinol oxidase subunit 3
VTETVEQRRVLDVSRLPATLFDTSALIWWGNTLLLFIETAMFGILIAIYFSVMMNTSPFPPPRVERFPVLYDTAPSLGLPIAGLIVLLASLIPGIWLDLSARKRNVGAIKIALIISLAFNIAAIVIRYYEFDSLHFKWNDNAYGSITWMILGMHLLHLITLACEDILLTVWTFVKGIDDKHALDLTVTAVYWYWIVGMWVILFLVVDIVPRMFG